MDRILKTWSHGAYGILQSLWIARAVQLGNVRRLQQNIAELCSAIPSNLGFTSCISERQLLPGSIRVDHSSEDAVIGNATRATIALLLINLVVIFDELAADLMTFKGYRAKKYPGEKAAWLRKVLPPGSQWSARGVTELIAIRNVLVHGNRTWNRNGIEMLRDAGVTVLPAIGTVVEPGVDDIFRYRRAVRTALNQIKKLPRRP